ncbi:MAG TPA: hypothetical protein VIA62_29530 [Thermoanaerobaculia bacterium]|jgi:hypothetical protein|nr:hypothetical protein [Thermoanaerobaculia bacterium]
MSTPYESAQLILKIFEMRREPVLREARAWFVREFNPSSGAEILALSPDQNRMFRMVTGYWDMACSLVNHDAIDRQMFLDANGELFGTFSKVQPHLAELRQLLKAPTAMSHMEKVVMSVPDAEARLEAVRNRLKAIAAQQAAAKP